VENEGIGSLEDIWPRQGELNRRAGFDTLGIGAALVSAERKGEMPEQGGVRLEAGRALKNYLDALASECHEMQECLSWKHWYKEAKEGRQYELRDLQNARVEATDMLFFWISLCQILGLTPRDVYRLYERKLGVNLRRQDEGRSQAEHSLHEHENRGVV
jgi:hypothetical protein